MTPKKDQVRNMFDDISGRYDLLNHLLSFGVDRCWRRTLVKKLFQHHPVRILDIATGTGDLALAMATLGPVKVTGIDLSVRMMEIARQKAARKNLASRVGFEPGDAEEIPFPEGSFDAVTVAFGVRNFEDLERGLAEMKRILVPGGSMMILEFSHPGSVPLKQIYGFYSRFAIPFIGRMISRHREAYRYLPDSVAAFPSGNDFAAILERTGMKNVSVLPLTGGIATLYSAEK
jgi:demethylmenaquinone methyltransferase/2-methoxy-6-polyprenyl-1,4-benzoquinol methylase